MKTINLISNKQEETINLAKKIAKNLPNGSVLTLTGDLGAGKTTFTRGLAQGLNIKEIIQSPTFNIMKIYFKGDRPLIHIDAYRLADTNIDIGLDEYIGYETGITAIEWPMYIERLIPNNVINVSITRINDNERKIIISGDEKVLEGLHL